MKTLRSISLLFLATLPLLSGCATNSALTLIEASQRTGAVVPGAAVIEQELKGRAFRVGAVYFDEQASSKMPAGVSRELPRSLLRQQAGKGFGNAGLEAGDLPPYPVDIAIEQIKFTRGRFLIPDPSVLRVRMEIRKPSGDLLMEGALESRLLPAVTIIVPGIVGAVPTAAKGQEWAALAKMIPAVIVAITRVTQGLQLGRGLDRIEIYPEASAPGALIHPDTFLHGNPYGLSQLTSDDLREAARASQVAPAPEAGEAEPSGY